MTLNCLKSCVLASVLTGFLALSACSGGKDQNVLNTPTYRQVNQACTSLDVSSHQFTSRMLRGLVKCFNSNGSMVALQKLMDEMSDEQVGTFADLFNRYLLKDPGLLYDYENSFYAGKASGTLTSSLNSVSGILDNPDLITSVLSLMNGASDSSRAQFYSVLQALAAKMDAQNIDELFSAMTTLNSSKAFQSLEHNAVTSDANSLYSLQDLTAKAIATLTEAQKPGSFSFITAISDAVQSGDFLPNLDQVLGTDDATIRANVPSAGTLFPVLSDNQGEILNGIGLMYADLVKPIPCLGGALTAQDPVLNMFGEIANQPEGGGADYVRREHLLRLEAVEPLCQYPASLKTHYIDIQKLGDSLAMLTVEHIARSAYRDNKAGTYPLIDIIHGFLTDPKTTESIPLMQEMTRRGMWTDLMLILAETSDTDRNRIASELAYFVDSIKDPLANILIEAGPVKAYSVASSLAQYFRRNGDYLLPIIKGLRQSLNDGGAHPNIQFAKNIFAQAPANDEFFKALFAISQSSNFGPTITLLSQMGTDGRLQDILGDWVVILHSVAVKGNHPIPAAQPLASDAALRADLQASDLTKPVAAPQLQNPDCEEVNLAIAPDKQWSGFTGCLSSEGGFSDVQTLINTLQNSTTDTGSSDVQFLEGFVQKFIQALSIDQIRTIAASFFQTVDNGSTTQALKSAGAMMNQKVFEPLLSFATPFVDPTSDARKDLDGLEKFGAEELRSAGFPLAINELDQATQQVSSGKMGAPTQYVGLNHDVARLERWIQNKECENSPNVQERTNEAIQDYENGVTASDHMSGAPRFSWSLDEVKTLTTPFLDKIADPAQNEPGHSLKDGLLAFLKSFSLKPGQTPTSDQQFTPQYLEQWFYDRANDEREITYYYVGDTPDQAPDSTPHVRLVSSLDRLEMILTNADFDTDLPVFKSIGLNIGKYAMAQLGDSWGDEPRALWPAEIRQKYANSQPPTLKQTVNVIEGLMEYMKMSVGFPNVPVCNETSNPSDPAWLQTNELGDNASSCDRSSYQAALQYFTLPPLLGCTSLPDTSLFNLSNIKRRLYNIAQIVTVLNENLPGSGDPQAGGLKFLRNLFFQTYYSTPERYRSPVAGINNNLSIIQFLVRSGIDRQLAFMLRRYQRNDPSLIALFSALASVGESSASSGLIDRLVTQDPSRTLIWNIAQQIYPYMGNSHDQTASATFDQTLISGAALLSNWNLVDPALRALNPALDQFKSGLTDQIDNLIPLFANADISGLVRALAEDNGSDGSNALAKMAGDFLSGPTLFTQSIALAQILSKSPQDSGALSTFETRFNQYESSSAGAASSSTLGRSLLNFFEEKPGQDIGTEKTIREFLASRLEAGDLDQMIRLAGSNPEKSEQLLETFAAYAANGDIEDFLGYVRRTVSGL
jgi:hypothetical protein